MTQWQSGISLRAICSDGVQYRTQRLIGHKHSQDPVLGLFPKPFPVQFIGALANSIFQSSLFACVEHFPRSGCSEL
jgi:hypothetical protein